MCVAQLVLATPPDACGQVVVGLFQAGDQGFIEMLGGIGQQRGCSQITGGIGVAIRWAGWCVPRVLHRGIAQQARMWFWRTATEPQAFCGLPAGTREGVFAFGSGLQSGIDDAWLSCLLK